MIWETPSMDNITKTTVKTMIKTEKTMLITINTEQTAIIEPSNALTLSMISTILELMAILSLLYKN